MFDTIEAAIDYLQSKLQDFYNRRYEMQTLYQQARVNLQDAYNKGTLVDEASKSLAEMISALDDYNQLSEKLKPLANAFSVETGLGIFPAIVVTAIWYLGGITATIAVAELLWGFYQRLDSQRVIVKAVKDGLLNPDVLTKPPTPGPIQSMLNSTTMLLLVGLGGWWLITSKAK